MTKSELGRALSLARRPDQRKGGRPKKLRRCAKCGIRLGAREMRAHRCAD